MELLEIPPRSLLVKPYKHPPLSIRPKANSYFGLNPSKISPFPPLRRFRGLHPFSCLGAIQPTSRLNVSASAIDPLVPELEEEDTPPYKKEKRGVVMKPMEKPRVVLKFIWMQKVIGIALDQVITGHGTIPLSPYHFWPKVDAWEQLKVLLESKPWISRKQLHILLNQATDVINLWQESGGHL